MKEIFKPRGEYHDNLHYTSEFVFPPIHSVLVFITVMSLYRILDIKYLYWFHL